MRQKETSWTKKLIGVAGALGLTFAMACASTGETDAMRADTESDRVAVGETTDPLGPPQHIATRPLTNEHPSSNTGFGNADSSGANTNLNTPAPGVVVTESDAMITQTPIVTEGPVVVETEPVQTVQVTTTMDEDDEEEVEVRHVTKKE